MEFKHSFVLTLTIYGTLVMSAPLCDETQRVEVFRSNLTSATGLSFSDGTFWHHQDDGRTYGCPCLIKACLKPCKDLFNGSYIDEDAHTIIHGEDDHVKVREKFHLLDPVDAFIKGRDFCYTLSSAFDDFKLLQNGSLLLSDPTTIIHMSKYCMKSENGSLTAVLCENHEDHGNADDGATSRNKKSSLLYPILGLVSSFFLFLVVVFFFLIPEMRTLQNKSVVFQSATLAIGLVGLSVLHLHRGLLYIPNACKFFAYISHYFILSSFTWLTTMCFNMFWTFSALKHMAAISQKSGFFKFKIYGVISTVFPLVILILMVILDFNLSEEWNIWPGIGLKRCWFQNRVSEFWFFQGPLLMMLLSNVGFSVATLASICKVKKESNFLNTSDSRKLAKENWQNLWLTMKLFTLMGGTWLMEFVSWYLEDQGVLVTIFDSINILRGPVIFYLCVIGNANVRKAIKSRLRPKSQISRRGSRSTTNSDLTSRTAASMAAYSDTAL